MQWLHLFGEKQLLTNENLPNGFEVAEVMKPYGFKDGDKVIQVNGEAIENVLDINKFLFLRDVSEVRVEHLNGKKENISVPEDIGTVMFENGAIRAFNPYWVPVILDSIIPDSPAYSAGLLKGDRIINVNGNDVAKWEEFTEQVKSNSSSSIDVKFKRGNKIISSTIPLNENNQIGVVSSQNQLN